MDVDDDGLSWNVLATGICLLRTAVAVPRYTCLDLYPHSLEDERLQRFRSSAGGM